MKKTKIIFFALIIVLFQFSSNLNASNLKIGNKNAKINVKVFSSLSCPHCADFHLKIFEKLKENYIDTGKVYFEHLSFPLNLAALNAEKIIRCTNNSTEAFKILKEFYEKQSKWTFSQEIKTVNKSLTQIAANENLNNKKIDKCLEDENIQDEILKERIEAQKNFNITSTPTIFVNNKIYKGKFKFEDFEKFLKKF